MTELQDLSPAVATDEWIQTEKQEKADATIANYKSLKRRWCEFCDEHDIESMSEVSGQTLMCFKRWRMDDVAVSTVGQNLSCLRSFVHYCEQIEAVSQGLIDHVPDAGGSGATRDEKVDQETAEAVLSHLRKFDYASRKHAVFEAIWHTTWRSVTVRAVDVCDCHLNEEAPYIELHNRPEADTRLKNGDKSEREVSISPDVADVLRDYIDHQRFDVEDDHGRRPLFTTRQGRVSTDTIRRDIREVTRPCVYGDGCPFDRTPAECPAESNRHRANECPGVETGHPVRRGSITHVHLDADIPKRVVSDRADVSVEVLEEHYDRQSEEKKREIRRGYLDSL